MKWNADSSRGGGQYVDSNLKVVHFLAFVKDAQSLEDVEDVRDGCRNVVPPISEQSCTFSH